MKNVLIRIVFNTLLHINEFIYNNLAITGGMIEVFRYNISIYAI